MIFLVDYDRATRRTLLFKAFRDDERTAAQDERLRLELKLNESGKLLEHEVVLLGVRDHLELWDAIRWQQYVEQHASRFDEVAEKAFRPNG